MRRVKCSLCIFLTVPYSALTPWKNPFMRVIHTCAKNKAKQNHFWWIRGRVITIAITCFIFKRILVFFPLTQRAFCLYNFVIVGMSFYLLLNGSLKNTDTILIYRRLFILDCLVLAVHFRLCFLKIVCMGWRRKGKEYNKP